MTGLPETDVVRVQRWCQDRVLSVCVTPTASIEELLAAAGPRRPGQPGTNLFHHPEKLLQDGDDDDP